MPGLPKLKIKLPSGEPGEYICDLEQAKDLFDFDQGIFMVDGQGVHSYDELIRIANQDVYKNRQLLEVRLLQVIDGG